MSSNCISVVILTKNNESTIRRTLESVQGFSEVVLLDSGSTDDTLRIASEYDCVNVYKRAFTNFGEMRNFGAKQAANDWILAVDSDEVVTEDLNLELQTCELKAGHFYQIPSRNFIGSYEVKHCGWSPDYKNRLYNRKVTSFKELAVHEDICTKNLVKRTCKNALLHFSYESFDEMLDKANTYSTLFANEYSSRKSGGVLKAYLRSLWTFFKIYVIKRGYRDGFEGYLIALTQSQTTFYKYLKICLKRRGFMETEDVIDHLLDNDETLDKIGLEESEHADTQEICDKEAENPAKTS